MAHQKELEVLRAQPGTVVRDKSGRLQIDISLLVWPFVREGLFSSAIVFALVSILHRSLAGALVAALTLLVTFARAWKRQGRQDRYVIDFNSGRLTLERLREGEVLKTFRLELATLKTTFQNGSRFRLPTYLISSKNAEGFRLDVHYPRLIYSQLLRIFEEIEGGNRKVGLLPKHDPGPSAFPFLGDPTPEALAQVSNPLEVLRQLKFKRLQLGLLWLLGSGTYLGLGLRYGTSWGFPTGALVALFCTPTLVGSVVGGALTAWGLQSLVLPGTLRQDSSRPSRRLGSALLVVVSIGGVALSWVFGLLISGIDWR